ncbi:MAG: MotE family protein [Pseudomonadota bacterium]
MIARLVRPLPVPSLSKPRRVMLMLASAAALSVWPATALWPQANEVDRAGPSRGLALPNVSEVTEYTVRTVPTTDATPPPAAEALAAPSEVDEITPLTAAELCGDLGAAGTLDGSGDDDAARQGAVAYCANIADDAADARYARKLAILERAEAQIQARLEELEVRRAAAEEWLRRRAEFMSAAEDSLVAIISAMRPDSAALQLAELDAITAAAVISRLSPRDASSILSEMSAKDGARLAAIIAGLHRTGINGSTRDLMDRGENIPTLTPGGRS